MDRQQYALLVSGGVTAWNRMRRKHPDTPVDLREADLSSADLDRADLLGADLLGADLSGASLYNVHLNEANLSGVNLLGVDLSGADVSGAHLTGVRLAQARGLPDAPVIPHLSRRICDEVVQRPGSWNMGEWHCGTSHCWAGWAVELLGNDGAALEDVYGTYLAAAFILAASEPEQPLPNFYASNAEAWDALCARAGRDVPLSS